MFDFFDPSKLVVVGIIALIFIGPKELPRVLRQVGQFVGKMRRMAAEFQGQFMDAMKEADVGDLKQDFAKLHETTKAGFDFNPIANIKNDIYNAMNSPATNSPAASASPKAPDDFIIAPVEPMPVPDMAAFAVPAAAVIDRPGAGAKKPALKLRPRPVGTSRRKPVARSRLPRKAGAAPRANGHASIDPDDRSN